MRKMILWATILLSLGSIRGQNLVANSSFENTSCDICSTLYEFYEGCEDDWLNYLYAPAAFDSSIPNCTFYNGVYYYAPDGDKHAMVGPNSGIFQRGDYGPGTYTISFVYTRGEAIYTNYPIFVNVGFANGMVNAEWNDQSNASIPIENVVSELVLEDDPVNWASYSGTFVLNDTYENLVIYGSAEEQIHGGGGGVILAPTQRALIDHVVIECQDCCTPDPVTITANGQDITNTLAYTIPCGENCVTLEATNVFNAVYNTNDPVLNDLEGTFCLPPDSTLTGFTATITGKDSCGDPYLQTIAISIEQDCGGDPEPCCDAEHNLLDDGDFNQATCGGNGAFNSGCVPNWTATDGSPSIGGFGTDPYAWMWSYNGNGEAIAANFDFVAGVTYGVCFRVRTDDKDTGDPNVANHATINLVATNSAGVVTASPSGEMIFNDVMGPYLNTWTDVSVIFTPTANFSQLWVFPFMQDPSTGGSQSEMSIDDIIISICCEDSITIEPYWNHPSCPEIICEAEKWPIQVLDSSGTPVTSAGGVVIEWTNLDTGAVVYADWVYAMALEHWQVVVTFPNGCTYTADYFEDCCNDDVHIEAIICPEARTVNQLKESMELQKDRYAASEYEALMTAIDQFETLYGRGDCDPCDIGYVLIHLVDGDGNEIDPADYTITWSDGGTGVMRLIPVDTLISVTVTQLNGEYLCVYEDEFIYECHVNCETLPAPTNLQSSGATLTWDPVPGAVSYIVSSPDGGHPPVFCDCSAQVSIVPQTTSTNSLVLSESLQARCFAWMVTAVCADGTQSEPSEAICFYPIRGVENGLGFVAAQISPNPNKGQMNFRVETRYDTPVSIEVYDFYGQLVQQFTFNVRSLEEQEVTWNASPDHRKGVYFVFFKTEKDQVIKKVIIE